MRLPLKSSTYICLLMLALSGAATAAEPASFDSLDKEYSRDIRPLVTQWCQECHSTEAQEGELDLQQFTALADVRRGTKAWLKVAEMLDNGEMPPKDAPQPTADQKRQLREWIRRYLDAEAHASAGDPGPVVLRRLSNAQYVYTVQDITGVPLNPLREFPSDNAAGEGFTNTGNALVMSPALLTKYLDAGKEIASHAVLLSDGFRFAATNSPRDWTDDVLARIRQTYLQHCDSQAAAKVNLHGLTWESRDAGRLPLDRYFQALLEKRAALADGSLSPAELARERKLNERYMTSLWQVLNDKQPSQLLDTVRAAYRAGQPSDAAAITQQIALWQQALTRFQSVGHMKSWMVAANPLTARQEFRVKLTPAEGAEEVVVYLAAGDAGDGAAHDFLTWQQPRLVAPGRPDLPLRDVRDFTREMLARRAQIFASAARALEAVDTASRGAGEVDVPALAKQFDVEEASLAPWLDYFGVGANANLHLDHFKQRIERSGGYEFVRGWGTAETPSLMANSSDQHVRIPGNLKPHGVVVHPSPTLSAVVGWRSPISASVRIEGKVTHAHPECGNGVTWALELRRGNTRQVLASGVSQGAVPQAVGPFEKQSIRVGDLLSLLIGPRDGNHACDLTDVELSIAETSDSPRTWNLNADVTADILTANPRADRYGNEAVWHFYTEPVSSGNRGPAVPTGSLLARWQSTEAAEQKQQLAAEVQRLLESGPPADAKHPDAVLYRQLSSLGGPLLARARKSSTASTSDAGKKSEGRAWGLNPALFGRHPDGGSVDAASLCVQAPTVIEVHLPADLATDCELVTAAVLDERTASEGSVQPLVVRDKPAELSVLRADAPVVTTDNSEARRRFVAACDDFRKWFPAALCYIRIVPVDEAVTLTLFHREDDAFCRLMLDDQQRAELDRLWNELHFVSGDALTLVDAFAQLMEYATQDSDPKLFEPYRKPIHDRAAAFRQELIDAEPRQLDALVAFAAKAYRRPLQAEEAQQLRTLYAQLREQELPHDEALRFTLARIFVSPEFLYRLEKTSPGDRPAPLNDFELANRLSYFLWSSTGDETLAATAVAGRLHEPDVLAGEAKRMLKDARVRRLAEEFACQWLHIYDLPTLEEKSERHFPTFLGLRSAMHEEAVRFFADLFARDASVLDIYQADYTFVNDALAAHYGIEGVTGPEWRRVDGVGRYGRGGILGLAATLARQSGASRTSPILRGNWVSEVLMGEKVPKPPKDVPLLPDDEASTAGLTVRQLVEKHTSDVRCSGCHARMDPLGFALEGYDAIGRRREKDLGDRPVDVRARLQDGAEFDGLPGLRNYLTGPRRAAILRQFNRKLLGFALGRGVQLSDEPLLSEMEKQLAANDNRISVAVETIVRSQQFREIRGRDAAVAEAP